MMVYLIRIVRVHMIEMYLLEQLVAVYRWETLNQAAEKLHLTQPTLSRSMQKIELEFGVPLFERKRNRLVLNEKGRLAAVYAEKILNMQKEMMEEVRAHRNLSVGFNAPGPEILMRHMLDEKALGLDVKCDLRTAEELFSGLRQGRYDMVVMAEKRMDLDLFCKDFCTEHLYLSVPRDNPYTRFRSITFEKVNGMTFVMADEIGIWKEIVKANMPDSRFLLQDSVDALSQIVVSSTIPSFVTDITLKYMHGKENRVYIPFAGEHTSCRFYLCSLLEKREMFSAVFEMFPAEV